MAMKRMPLMEELRNGLNLDGFSDDFGTWDIRPDITDEVGKQF